MTAEQFAYWFQGFAELSESPPTQAQWDSMREHVATVFKKVTPSVRTGGDHMTQEQARHLREFVLRQRRPVITC